MCKLSYLGEFSAEQLIEMTNRGSFVGVLADQVRQVCDGLKWIVDLMHHCSRTLTSCGGRLTF
jgi:hypothetical protein